VVITNPLGTYAASYDTIGTMTTKTAAIYCRISSDPQGERAGVERQQRDCEQLATRLGLDVVSTFIDNDVSAYSGKRRPEFERMLTAAAAGDFDVVICWATDRLYRRVTDLSRITDELAPHAKIRTVNGGEIDLETIRGNPTSAGAWIRCRV
jgi:site-specific DNA recombinase